MNVRVLLFHKHLNVGYSLSKKGWITLCHLEEVESIEPRHMSLEEIKRNNDDVYKRDSESCYHHLIYLIDTNAVDKRQASDRTLWNDTGKYLSITRIHLPKTIKLQNQLQALNTHFAKCAADYPDILWRTYLTTELSDLVLVSSSNCLGQLSKWTLMSTNSEKIGKTYTYFCVPNSLLESIPRQETDTIDYLSLRFSIRNCKSAPIELENICKCLEIDWSSSFYRVTGNEDAILCGFQVSTAKVIELYKKWYENGLNILNTFSEVIVRIGIKGTKPNFDANDIFEESQLTKQCVSLQNRLANTLTAFSDEREWKRPMIVLSNALIHMSRSATLDESVYQILPGLVAFWKNIHCGNLQDKDEKIYLRSMELCVHTMEDLMRAEGQLSRQPEDRPIAYDIPIFSLECATAFLQTLNSVLIAPDGEATGEHRFFLVPSAETDVSTLELFSATKETPGLLQIDIPFSWLYEPQRLFPALLHEVAHYVGENCRMREQRYHLVLKCVCNELTEYYFEPVLGSRENLQKFLLSNLFEKELPKEIASKPLRDIFHAVIDIVRNLSSQEAFAELTKDYLVDYHGTARYTCPSIEELPGYYDHLIKRLNDLRILFRETYADACMLYILRPSLESYLSMTLDPERSEINTSTYLRIYIGLQSAGYQFDDIYNSTVAFWNDNPAKCNKAKSDLLDLNKHFQNDSNSSEMLLLRYISMCWASFTQSYDESMISAVRLLYKEMTKEKDTFDYQSILPAIDQSRQAILKWLEGILA